MAIFEEPPVHSDKGDRHTNDACTKHSESNYTIDGTDVTFPAVVPDASMLMNGFLVNLVYRMPADQEYTTQACQAADSTASHGEILTRQQHLQYPKP